MSTWLATSGWLIGLVLFVRFAQILPCCQTPPLETILHSSICGQPFVIPCPRYADAAPR